MNKSDKLVRINVTAALFSGFIWTFLFATMLYYIKWGLCADLTTGTVDNGKYALYSGIASIGYHIDLPLGGHVVLEYFLLLFGERVGQRISGFHKFVQRFRILGVAFEAALAGANVTEIKIFQNQHLDTSLSN